MKPRLVNNSIIPKILSKISPINIWAITIWPFVFCRGELSQETANHESIHIEQYNDLLVIGFLLIYAFDYLHGLVKYRNDISGLNPYGREYKTPREKAYFRIRAEQEAYENEDNFEYLKNRKRFSWILDYKV